MNIDEMSAGREMDALLWLALEGKPTDLLLTCRYVDGDVQPHAGYPLGHISPPHYSTDIAAAWEVIELLGERDWGRVDISRTKLPPTGYYQCIMRWATHAGAVAYGETAPLAICRAALKAVRAGDAGGR